MKRDKKLTALDIAVCMGIVISCVFSAFISLENTCDDIKENVFRLHIIANSDSLKDQKLKLEVRDAVLEETGELFSLAKSAGEAEEITRENLESVTLTAQKIVDENGFDYKVRLEIGESFFPTREYESVTLPAGKYRALRIILGKGEGHNWWCVMFPPMCLGAATADKEKLGDILGEASAELVSDGKKYEIKFKIVEWYEQIKYSIEEKYRGAVSY